MASWLYEEEDKIEMDERSVLDPTHPVQEEWKEEGWEQLREEETADKEEEVNPGCHSLITRTGTGYQPSGIRGEP